MITLSGYILVEESEFESIRQALLAHIQATRAEAGCLVFDVEESATEKRRFDVYEQFVDRAAFEFHQKRVQESPWGTVSKNAKRFYTIEET